MRSSATRAGPDAFRTWRPWACACCACVSEGGLKLGLISAAARFPGGDDFLPSCAFLSAAFLSGDPCGLSVAFFFGGPGFFSPDLIAGVTGLTTTGLGGADGDGLA